MTAVIERPTGLVTRELADESDWTPVDALVASCSPASLARRFFLPYPLAPDEATRRFQRYLRRAPATLAFAANTPIGLLNLTIVGDQLAEAAILVADAWQRQGVGTLLVRATTQAERWRGWTVRATVQADNVAALRLLRRAGPTLRLADRAPGEFTVELIAPS